MPELTLPEWPPEILKARAAISNDRWVEFADIVLTGKKPAQAWARVMNKKKAADCWHWANQVYAKPEVRHYIDMARKYLWEGRALELIQKRIYLMEVVTTPLPDMIDEDGNVLEEYAHLVQSMSIRERFNKDGDMTSRTINVAKPDVIRAIQVDNTMAGHDAPTQHDHNVSGGIGLGVANLNALLQSPAFLRGLLKQVAQNPALAPVLAEFTGGAALSLETEA